MAEEAHGGAGDNDRLVFDRQRSNKEEGSDFRFQ
jgi:hypothetical protein